MNGRIMWRIEVCRAGSVSIFQLRFGSVFSLE